MSTSITPTSVLNSSAPVPPTRPPDPLADQNIFLQLLVQPLKNQDPQNPADGTQFITQLAQFSTLSNSAQMLEDLDAIKQSLAVLGTSPISTKS